MPTAGPSGSSPASATASWPRGTRSPCSPRDLGDGRGAGVLRRAAAHPVQCGGAGEPRTPPAPRDVRGHLRAQRRLRRGALAPRHLDVSLHPALGRADGADDARPAGPGLPARPDAALRLGAAGLDQRRPAARGGGPRPHVGGDGLQRPRPLVVRRAPHDSDGYLGFVGRIAEEKGPLAAIEIAVARAFP